MTQAHDIVVFDLDGTISDPAVGISRSINHALACFGYAPIEESLITTYVGPPLDETFASITGVTSEVEIHKLVAKYRERYAEVGYSENSLYPGVPDALRNLHKDGIPLGVCTSKPVKFAEKILELFGLNQLFEFVSGGEIGVKKWQQLAELSSQGLVTKSSVMVGDRAVDLIAAHKNGMSAAGVLWATGKQVSCLRKIPAICSNHRKN